MPEKPAPKNLWSLAEKNFRPLVLALSGLFLFGSGMFLAKVWRFRSPPPITYEVSEDSSEEEAVAKVPEEETRKIKVEVSGAVNSPGVYELSEDSRVEDAISEARGFSTEADAEWVSRQLNLAAKIGDGEKLYIPKKGEVAGVVAGSRGGGQISPLGESAPQKININTASKSELETLPGIGPTYAQRIIDYRSSNPFDSVEEIIEVKGIGEKTFEKIKDQIVVR